MTEKLAQSTDIRTALVVGGLSMQVQASTLKTSPEIVVATPVSPCLLFWCMGLHVLLVKLYMQLYSYTSACGSGAWVCTLLVSLYM